MAAGTEAPAQALSIAGSAEASGLRAHTLRSYERTGLLEPVSRNGSGDRRSRTADLERITCLARLRAARPVDWMIGVYRERLGPA